MVFSSCWSWTHPGCSPPSASCSELSSTLTSRTERCDTGIVVGKRLRIVLTICNILSPCVKGFVVTEVQNRFRQQLQKFKIGFVRRCTSYMNKLKVVHTKKLKVMHTRTTHCCRLLTSQIMSSARFIHT